MTLTSVGPAHPWLVQTYAEVIPYPCGSILGQELFQSGAIPSDTDYRIFKEFGGDLPGKNKYVFGFDISLTAKVQYTK